MHAIYYTHTHTIYFLLTRKPFFNSFYLKWLYVQRKFQCLRVGRGKGFFGALFFVLETIKLKYCTHTHIVELLFFGKAFIGKSTFFGKIFCVNHTHNSIFNNGTYV